MVSAIRAWAHKSPLTASVVATGAYVLLFGIFVALQPGGGGGAVLITPERVAQVFWPEFLLALSSLAIVWVFGWAREVRLTTPLAAKSVRVLILPLLLLLLLFATGAAISAETGIQPSWSEAFSYARVVIWVGVFEEVVFRGLLLYGLATRIGPVRAALVSSLIFGLLHYGNWASGQGALISHFQVIHATSLGVMMAAITLRTGSLWPAILYHAVWDLGAVLNLARAGEVAMTEAMGVRDLAPALMLSGVELAIGLGILAFWARGRARRAQ